MSCSECGIGQIIKDDYGAETNFVCDNCGSIQKNTFCESLVSTPNPNFESVALQKKYRANVDQQLMRWLPSCKKEMNACIDVFSNDNEAIKKNAHDILLRMSRGSDGSNFSKRRDLLAAACVYSALKQFEIPVSIHAVTSQMGTTSSKIHRILSKIKKTVGGGSSRPLIEEEVKVALNNLPIIKDGEHITEKAMELYSLLDRFTLVDGRTPTAVAAVCAYFTLASKEKMANRCISNFRFCQENGLPVRRTYQLIGIVKSRLILLAKRLPYVDPSSVNERNYHVYINPILRYKDTLISNFAAEAENPTTDAASLCTPPCFFRDMKYPPVDDTPEVSTSEILCEEDLPESEIGLYLRTTDEVSKVENINQLLQSGIDDTPTTP